MELLNNKHTVKIVKHLDTIYLWFSSVIKKCIECGHYEWWKIYTLLSYIRHCNEEAKFPLSRGRIDSWMCYGANEWQTLIRSVLLSWTSFGAKDDMSSWGVMEHGCEILEAMDETLIMRNLYVNNFMQSNIRVWIHLMGTIIDHSSHT